jgi:hypothetical protein
MSTIKGQVTMTSKQAWDKLGNVLGDMKRNILEAGQLVCWLLDNDTDARDKFRKLGVTPSVYLRLEKVGRGVLLPELAEHSMFSRLPIDQQKQIVAGKVTAVIENGKGDFDTVQVDILQADPVTMMRCIATDHIRTPAEQRLYIERMRKPMVTATEACKIPWRVIGKNIEFIKPCVMTRNDMLSAMRAMEG